MSPRILAAAFWATGLFAFLCFAGAAGYATSAAARTDLTGRPPVLAACAAAFLVVAAVAWVAADHLERRYPR